MRMCRVEGLKVGIFEVDSSRDTQEGEETVLGDDTESQTKT